MNENKFQSNLIKEIKSQFPGSIVLKNDASYLPGIPDLLILYEDKWAALECKKESKAHKQPNQPYYVDKMNSMSFASIISPDNKEEVINGMARSFGLER